MFFSDLLTYELIVCGDYFLPHSYQSGPRSLEDGRTTGLWSRASVNFVPGSPQPLVEDGCFAQEVRRLVLQSEPTYDPHNLRSEASGRCAPLILCRYTPAIVTKVQLETEEIYQFEPKSVFLNDRFLIEAMNHIRTESSQYMFVDFFDRA